MSLRKYISKFISKFNSISKISSLNKRLFTKFHSTNHFNKVQDDKQPKKNFSRFHERFYKDHILELANDLTNEEQIVAAEVSAEPDVQKIEKDPEQSDINTIEDLLSKELLNVESPHVPENSSIQQIIIKNGQIVEKIFLTPEDKKICITF